MSCMLENVSIGTDIEEIIRFKDKSLVEDQKFLEKIFTKKELEYCFSKGVPHQHLCARYCAKEAIVKALTGLGIVDVYYSDIEITNKANGFPIAKIQKYPKLNIKITLSHCKTYATATALVSK